MTKQLDETDQPAWADNKTRPSGFYWVRYGLGQEVAKWSAKDRVWWRTGDDLPDHDLDVISPVHPPAQS